MKMRYFFSEKPYAVALNRKYLDTLCSTCAQSSTSECSCGFVTYCCQECCDYDRPMHVDECRAFSLGNGACERKMETEARLVARMIARYRLDKGQIVLSDDFPRHVTKDRCFDDLMSHQFELRFSQIHRVALKEVTASFKRFFKDTEMSKTPRTTLRKFYARYWVNGFSLIPQFSAIGSVIYLNASRFNHSCRPTCLYRFEGARIVIEHIDREANNNDDKDDDEPAQFNAEQLAALTLTYGFGRYYNYECCCSLTEQRQKSLRPRYFFKCQCELCSDTIRSSIEINSAPVDCPDCKAPYVWYQRPVRRSIGLRRTCKCGGESERGGSKSTKSSSLMPIAFGNDVAKRVKLLMQKWPRTMKRLQSANTWEAIVSCNKVLMAAECFWHPTHNLRLGQLYEKLFVAMERALIKNVTFVGDKDQLDAMITVGRKATRIYGQYFQPYMLPVARMAMEVAELYKIRCESSNDLERSRLLLQFAAKAYKDRKKLGQIEAIEKQIEWLDERVEKLSQIEENEPMEIQMIV